MTDETPKYSADRFELGIADPQCSPDGQTISGGRLIEISVSADDAARLVAEARANSRED